MATMDKIFAGYAERLSALESTQASNPLARGVAWIQGELVPLKEARIPLQDEGFMHSDLTYDVPSVWDGRFFRLDDHLDRLEASCRKLRLRLPLPRADVRAALEAMVARSGIRDAFVELIVTRGLRGVRGAASAEALLAGNNLYMLVEPFVWVMAPDVQRAGGGSAIVARTVRRVPPGAFDPTVKNLQWGDLVRGLLEAHDRGAAHAFLTDGDTNLTEGSGFNIVVVRGGVLYTPDRGCLEGITRRSVVDAARDLGYELRMEVVPVAAAYEADEIFMSTTAGGIMPITILDGKPVADGKVGPITKAIWDRYWAMHWEDEFSFKVNY